MSNKLLWTVAATSLFNLAALTESAFAAQIKMDKVNQWNGGFQGKVVIENDENKTIKGWKLEFSAGFKIDQIWNANLTAKNNGKFVLTNVQGNGNIDPSQSIEFGFIASPGASPLPTKFKFNGVGDTDTPTDPTPDPDPQPKPKPGKGLPDDDWLSVSGKHIVDKDGRVVWLTGANWFGFNTTERVLHGLWSANLDDTIKAMADRGINLLRVPFSTEIVNEWMNNQFKPIDINAFANPELEGMNSLEVFDAMIASAKKHGMKILLDAHSAEADNMGHIYPLWSKGDITTDIFYDTWVWLAKRYKNDDTVIAFDLENEPHGRAHRDAVFAKWDNSKDDNNWKHVAEEVSKRILAVHPDILIMIEGIEVYPMNGTNWNSKNGDDYHFNWWGGNLMGVRDYPVRVSGHQDKIMYSPHDYGPAVSDQAWFYDGFNKDTLIADVWQENWLYIHQQEISPLLIGEWGGFLDGGDNEQWMVSMRELLDEYKMHHTFWCLNPNSGDTGGLLNHDWKTWDEAKYAILEPVLWQTPKGQYIGLDHEIPLGSKGVTVTEHYRKGGAEPTGL